MPSTDDEQRAGVNRQRAVGVACKQAAGEWPAVAELALEQPRARSLISQ